MGSTYDYRLFNDRAWLGFEDASLSSDDLVIDVVSSLDPETHIAFYGFADFPFDNTSSWREVIISYNGTNLSNPDEGRYTSSFLMVPDNSGVYTWQGDVPIYYFDGRYSPWELNQIILGGNDIIYGSPYMDILCGLD